VAGSAAGDQRNLWPLRTRAPEDLAVAGEPLGRSRGGLTSEIRLAVNGRGLAFTGTERRDQIPHRKVNGSAGGRPPAFDQDLYAGRNVIEPCFARLEQFRALATRYAQRAAYYRTGLTRFRRPR
jgi:transposase